jgi:hypothetical protein
MNYDLIFLLEEPSMEVVLNIILPTIIPTDKTFICIKHQGKQDLQKSIPRKLKAFQNVNSQTKFIIVHDQDSQDCKILKKTLLEICKKSGNPDVLIRIICHELESWFLGDLAAVEKAYGLKTYSLSKDQNKTKFRDPDRLNSAKDELRKLVAEYYPLSHSRKIAPYLSPSQNTSKSFQVFIEGIHQFIGA